MGLLNMGHSNQITSLTTTQAELLIELRYTCFPRGDMGYQIITVIMLIKITGESVKVSATKSVL